ncbi:MAG: hypothetical protein ACO3JL_04560, partial [Myxococcota bacterium]
PSDLAHDPDDAAPDGFGVMELFRLSVNDLVRRLDDPLDRASFYDTTTGNFSTQELPKVYHLNLVLRAEDSRARRRYWARHRVVVNRRGILRIDPVVERTEDMPPP